MSTTEKKYFALGNINHDGKEYKRGDSLVLTAKAAAQLEDVLSLEKPVDPEPEAPVEVPAEKKPEPKIGGAALDSGEPSLDGSRETGAASKESKKSFLERLGFTKKEGDTTEVEKHIISEEDLKLTPELAERGIKVGDEVELGPEISTEEAEKLLAENGGAPATDPSKDL